MIRIFLDDLRKAPDKYNLVFRTGEDLIDWCKDNRSSKIDLLSLDHDLGEEDTYDGYSVVKEMCDLGMSFGRVQLHTSNNQGALNMYHYLKNAATHGLITIDELYDKQIECIDGEEVDILWGKLGGN